MIHPDFALTPIAVKECTVTKRLVTKAADTAQHESTGAIAMPAGLDPFSLLGLNGLQTLFSIHKGK